MKTVTYLRVSTNEQDLSNQKLAILEFAQKEGFKIDEFVQATISTQRKKQREQLDDAIQSLKKEIG